MYNHFTGRVFNFLMTGFDEKSNWNKVSNCVLESLSKSTVRYFRWFFSINVFFIFFFHFLSATILAIVKQNFYNRKSLVNTIKRFRIQKENPLFFFNRNQKTWKTYRILCTRKEYIEYKKVRQVREEVLLFLFLQTNLSFDISFQKEY